MSFVLSQDQKHALKSKAHALNPLVRIASKGLTENVLTEIREALRVHELIKIKISGYEKEDRLKMLEEISEKMGSNLIQSIGHIAILYKKNEQKMEKRLAPKVRPDRI